MTTAVKSPVTAYAEAVTSGAVLVGRYVRLACERHLRDLLRTDIYFDEKAADRVIEFFGHLSLSGVSAGQPFKLQPWQAFIVGSLFGWKATDGSRRFTSAYVEIGKGNGKSPMAAGIGLYMMIADGRQAAEVYSAAVDRDQAKILFRDAVAMVNQSPALDARITRSGGRGNEWNLAHLPSSSFFRPISSEHTGGRGKSGFRVHCGLCDELHEHPTDVMVRLMRANMKGENALLLMITNSGFDRRTICWVEHETSVRILEGVIDNDSVFAYICSLDPCERHRLEGKIGPEEDCDDCDDWRDMETLRKANPNLGVSISERYLSDLRQEALTKPSQVNLFKRLNACMWTETVSRWLSDETWNSGSAAPVIEGDCFAAWVAPSAYEMAAFVLWFPQTSSVLPFFWCPDERVQQRRADQVPYDLWAQDGFLTVTEGQILDYDVMRKAINDLGQKYRITEIATSRYNETQLETQLMGDGFEMKGFLPSFKDMSPGLKELERLLTEGTLKHGGHPILRWMVANAAVKTDAGGLIRLDKESSADITYGLEGLAYAIQRSIVEPDDSAGVLFV